MVRVKRGKVLRRRRRKLFKRAKGFRCSVRTKLRSAKPAVYRAMEHATRHRRQKKGVMRSLWIARINAAVRKIGLSYSRFMAAVKKAKIALDRRSLADLALNHPKEFAQLLEVAKVK